MAKSYYEVLNVDKNASQDEIKKAFRKLSKQYHPDLAEDKATAEEKYKEITQAYDVLSDEDKRRRYDMLGHDNYVNGGANNSGFGGFDGFSGFEGFNFSSTGFSGFEDIFSSFFSGGARRVNTKGADIQLRLELTLEEINEGITKTIKYRRKTEKGDEVVEKKVTIPQGVEEGKRFVIRQGGHIGQAYQNIPAEYGDLYIVIQEKAHKYFRRLNEYDIEYVLQLEPIDAILGKTVEIPTLSGESVKINVAEGTQNDKLYKLSGKGIKSNYYTGSIYIRVKIVVPQKISKKEKKLYEEIRKLREDKDENKKGFFDGLFS